MAKYVITPRLFVDVEAVIRALAGGDCGRFVRAEINAENLFGAFEAGFEADFARAGAPVQLGGNQIEIICNQMRGGAASGGRDVEFRELAAHGLAGEQDLLAVGRPARRVVVEGVVGDLRQRAAVGGDYPDVAIVAVVVFLAGAVGNERDAGAVGRPLRIRCRSNRRRW